LTNKKRKNRPREKVANLQKKLARKKPVRKKPVRKKLVRKKLVRKKEELVVKELLKSLPQRQQRWVESKSHLVAFNSLPVSTGKVRGVV